MRHLKIMLAWLCALLMTASCSNEMEPENTTGSDVAQLIKIGNFPAFDEETQTRALGAADPGKTAWADGDKVLLKIELKNETAEAATPQCFTLTYSATGWAADKPLNLSDYRATTADITAYYAPAYEWNATSLGNLKLKSGKTAGTDEYLVDTATGILLKDGINIDFSKARTYSRLRVAAVGVSNLEVTLSAGTFTPAGTDLPLGETTIKATTDAKGNAYFYGSWTAGTTLAATLKDDKGEVAKVSKTVTGPSVSGQSYAIDGFANLAKVTGETTLSKSGYYIIKENISGNVTLDPGGSTISVTLIVDNANIIGSVLFNNMGVADKATLILNNAKITGAENTYNAPPILVSAGEQTIKLIGDNTLTPIYANNYDFKCGIQLKNENANVIIEGTEGSSLTVSAQYGNAAIGGKNSMASGNITIRNATLNLSTKDTEGNRGSAAAIGSGSSYNYNDRPVSCGVIKIINSDITAKTDGTTAVIGTGETMNKGEENTCTGIEITLMKGQSKEDFLSKLTGTGSNKVGAGGGGGTNTCGYVHWYNSDGSSAE